MKAIETTITVGLDRMGTVELPGSVSPGKHSVIMVIEESSTMTDPRKPLDLPAHDVGPWPANVSLRREDMYGDDGR